MKEAYIAIQILLMIGFWIALGSAMIQLAKVIRMFLNIEDRSNRWYMLLLDFFILTPKFFRLKP